MKSELNQRQTTQEPAIFGTVLKLWPYIWPRDHPHLKRRIFIALLFLVLAKITTALVPFFFKFVTDMLAGHELDLPVLPAFLLTPLMLIGGFVALRILNNGFNQLRDALFARVGQHAIRQLAFKTFDYIHKLSLRFHLERRTGGLSRIIERGTKGIESIVRYAILNSFPLIIEFALYAGIFFYYFGFFFVIAIALTVLLYSYFTIKTSDWRAVIRRDMNLADTNANAKAVDSLLNYETVKYFGNEGAEVRRFDESLEKYEDAAIRSTTSLGWLNFGQTTIFSIGMFFSLFLSARAVQNGTQTIGDFVLIQLCLIQIAQPLNFIGSLYREIRQSLIDIEVMFNLLNTPIEIADDPNAVALRLEAGHIEFKDVYFHYVADRPILNGISFEIPPGKTVAIVGPTGSGKSTISRLLYRFYDAKSGKITIDGQDVRKVKQYSLRAVIGMVPQDTVLFNDTIGYNIHYGRLDATMAEIKAASEYAQIDKFITSLPKGFETEVGERGLKLSGGEKQRVAIARTILKSPPILILDEATSALDTQTEQRIKLALDLVSRNRTTLVIAHRLSTIIDSDEIIVLDRGGIAERGTHEVLIAKKGLYETMWNRQQEMASAQKKLIDLASEGEKETPPR